MMILQKLVVKQGRVAVNVYNKHFDFKFPYDVHCWLKKYVVRAFCLSVLVIFHRFFIILVPGTYSNLTRVWKSSKSIFSHLVLYEKGPSQKVPDLRVFY